MSTSITPGSRVLVTGVTGFIGSHIADQLLKAGYSVKGTTRSLARTDHLQKLFGQYSTRFEVVEVGDLQKEGVFDEAVKDVDAICHLATPVTFQANDPFKDLIEPAVQGTLSLLKSAQLYGKDVKHVVVTSSIAAVLHPADAGYTYTEDDWNNEAVEFFKNWKEGEPVNGFIGYIASKNEAEKAAWRFRKEQQPSFKLTTILPSLVFGPDIRELSKPEGTPSFVFSYFSGEKKQVEAPQAVSPWIDVRDVALAHVRALEKGEASDGERFLTTAGTFTYQLVVDVLRKEFPERRDIIVEGEPGKNYETQSSASGQKATRILGVNYDIPFEQCIVDTVNSLKHFL